MKRYKRFFSESKKWNSDFSGFIIPNVNAREYKPIIKYLQKKYIPYDALKDLNYYQIVTDVDDTQIAKKIIKDIEHLTGKRIFDIKFNK